MLKKCNGIWDASYLGEEANLKNTQSNSFSAEKFVLSMYMCKYVTFVLWMLMNASRLAFDSHVHIPFLNYFCFRSSSENRGERDLRGSPRDCRYDTVIYVIPSSIASQSSRSSQLYGMYPSSQTAWLASLGVGCLNVSTVSTFLYVLACERQMFLLTRRRWGMFREEERLRLSDRNSILMT